MKNNKGLGKHQFTMLEFLLFNNGWHSASSIDDGTTTRTMLSLEKRGLVEVIRYGRNNYQFRLTEDK